MPADMRSFIYDPRAWEDDEPPPVRVADPKPVRHDFPVAEVFTIYSVPAAHSPLRPRDFSALRSESAHPWRTIRRRNHRLLPQRRPFPHSLPKRMLAPEELPPPPPATLIPIHGLLTEDPNDRVPVLVLPRPVRLPWDPYHFIPSQFPLPVRSLPGETAYGPVQSGLALVCAREYPWTFLAHANISEIAWGAHPPDVLDEREDVLHELPPDQLVFLAVLVQICNLEPVFTSFLEPAIADFRGAGSRPYITLFTVIPGKLFAGVRWTRNKNLVLQIEPGTVSASYMIETYTLRIWDALKPILHFPDNHPSPVFETGGSWHSVVFHNLPAAKHDCYALLHVQDSLREGGFNHVVKAVSILCDDQELERRVKNKIPISMRVSVLTEAAAQQLVDRGGHIVGGIFRATHYLAKPRTLAPRPKSVLNDE
ncbi:hypothetical protein B0H11DRAFT_2291464 [Mycena galericulata]|nr:hypothetical protein B0H11DRAFT_2291464 [Mycena galericulata]